MSAQSQTNIARWNLIHRKFWHLTFWFVVVGKMRYVKSTHRLSPFRCLPTVFHSLALSCSPAFFLRSSTLTGSLTSWQAILRQSKAASQSNVSNKCWIHLCSILFYNSIYAHLEDFIVLKFYTLENVMTFIPDFSILIRSFCQLNFKRVALDCSFVRRWYRDQSRRSCGKQTNKQTNTRVKKLNSSIPLTIKISSPTKVP